MSTFGERQCHDKKVFTKEELLEYWTLEQTVRQENEEIINLQSKATRITSSFSDSPKGQASNDTTGRIYAELIDRKATYYEKRLIAERTRNEILKYIIGIDDAKTRLVLQLRYLDFLSWKKVAAEVGGDNTKEGVQRITERFFKKQNT